MEAFHLCDISSITYNKNIERIISSMVAQLCHLIISMERRDVENETFAGLGTMAEELAKASEQLAHFAKRLAGESDEEVLKMEMVPAAEFLLLSGKNILLVAQKLYIHPDNQCHQEDLIITAQKILVGTVKLVSKSHGASCCPAEPTPDPYNPFLRDDAMDKWRDGSNRIEQLTREMATEVFHMAQSLKRKGPIMTKAQLITSAKKTATSGHKFVKFIRLLAKNCLDQRCADELLCVLEQIQTMSSQLNIISSVKAALASSKSSEELLVNNAQNLLQGVLHTLKAAEAACLRGLREPLLDADEMEAAAFCMQWKRELLKHRSEEASNADRDESGLRKTAANKAPTLVSMVQEPWTT
uniref:Vinculin n=1 Tax=Sarcophilus harrisii TaxID=9305 RepID=A0A7N4P3F3_SARHA